VDIRIQLGAHRSQKRLRGPGQRLDDRSIGRLLAQGAQLVDLRGSQLGIQLLHTRAVVVFKPGAQQLTDPGKQTIVGAERLGLDQKVRGHLIGLQRGGVCGLLQ